MARTKKWREGDNSVARAGSRTGGEVERRNPNFLPLSALRNKFNFVGGGGGVDGVGHFLARRYFLSFAVAAYWNLEGAREGRRRERGRAMPDGVKRALNHDQSAFREQVELGAAPSAAAT